MFDLAYPSNPCHRRGKQLTRVGVVGGCFVFRTAQKNYYSYVGFLRSDSFWFLLERDVAEFLVPAGTDLAVQLCMLFGLCVSPYDSHRALKWSLNSLPLSNIIL